MPPSSDYQAIDHNKPPPAMNDNDKYEDDEDEPNPRHENLKAHPTVWASIGVLHTLLTSGIIFGWASLLPVLRSEGVHHSPSDFATIFTFGAVGNYISTLFFGLILDKAGPRLTGIVASLLFAMGLFLTSFIHSFACLAVGFALLGFAGPGIQMPTLHLANLFTYSNNNNKNNTMDDDDEDESNKESGSAGGAFFMSAQAAAFDGGTAIFAILRLLFQLCGLSSQLFLRVYMIIPAWVFVTSVLVWPDEILEDERTQQQQQQGGAGEPNYVGVGSPYLSPGKRRKHKTKRTTPINLVNAPLTVVLSHPAFWSLAIWTSIHILKLNFIVATINDQLEDTVDPTVAKHLIDVFGAMLPFGFVVLPVVATLLDTSALMALQLGNLVGLFYGAVLVFFPGSAVLQTIIVFPSVAMSRQLVYSTLFHQVGQLFGFANYGTLLGLINVCVSSLSAVQTPLVNWSETVGSYTGANTMLWVLTMPLVLLVIWAVPGASSGSSHKTGAASESTPLNLKNGSDNDAPTQRSSYV